MNKLIVAFMLFFLVNIVLDGIMEGGGGIATTQLTTAITPASAVLNVRSTSGFMRSDYVQIGDEKIRHSSTTATTFVVTTRGYDNTEATSHPLGAKVYSSGSSVVNSALGFNVASTGASIGAVDIPLIVWSFFTTTLPKVITWDFAHFRVSEWLQMLRYIFLAITVGFVVYMAYNIAAALGGIMQRMFART